MKHQLSSLGFVGDGVTLNDAAFSALTLAPGDILDLGQGAQEYVFASPITLPDNIRVVSESGLGALRWTSALGGNAAINAGAAFRPEGVKIIGPTTSAFVGGQTGIRVIGTLANRKRGPILDSSVEISGFGHDGVYCEFVYDPIVNAKAHHCGYSGFTFLSSNGGRSRDMRVSDIVGLTVAPGIVNAYGLCLSHDSTGYDGLGRASSKPFCEDWIVDGAIVERIDWEGIDAHGAVNCHIQNCRVYETSKGIAMANSSGDAAGYAGENNSIVNCLVDSRARNGVQNSKYLRKDYGINVSGGSIARHRGIKVIGNTVYGHGIAYNSNSGAIQAGYCDNLHIANNTIEQWGGSVFVVFDSLGIAVNNRIDGAGVNYDSVKYIFSAQAGAGRMRVAGNGHLCTSGNGAKYGLYKHPSATMIWVDGGNDFLHANYYSN